MKGGGKDKTHFWPIIQSLLSIVWSGVVVVWNVGVLFKSVKVGTCARFWDNLYVVVFSGFLGEANHVSMAFPK